jgi:hypothetical protein
MLENAKKYVLLDIITIKKQNGIPRLIVACICGGSPSRPSPRRSRTIFSAQPGAGVFIASSFAQKLDSFHQKWYSVSVQLTLLDSKNIDFSATGHRPQATGHRPQATGHRPQATGQIIGANSVLSST